MAEGFEGGDGHAGDGNRVVQRIEDFDGISLCAIRGHAMVHQFYGVAAMETTRRHIGIGNRMSTACSHRLFTSRNGLAPDETDRPMLTSFKPNCAEVAPGIPINSPQTH